MRSPVTRKNTPMPTRRMFIKKRRRIGRRMRGLRETEIERDRAVVGAIDVEVDVGRRDVR